MSRPTSHPIDHPFDFGLPTVTEPPLGEPSEAPPGPLKRRASSTFDISGDNSRKRLREDLPPDEAADAQAPALISGKQLADDLEQDLLCGCCSALLYRPVIVYPCQHYFCGR
jgi:E3 ubiquitin-protein ligase CHFR